MRETQHKNSPCKKKIKMDELFEHITPRNTYLSYEDIKVEDLNHEQTSNATFVNVCTTENCYPSTQEIVKVENLKEIHDCIPDVSVKTEDKIKPENSTETFFQSNINIKDISKTESPCDTQIPYTAKLEKVMKDENSPSTHLQYSNVKLEVNMEAENSPKIQTSFNDIKIKVEKIVTAEISHDAHFDRKCENEMNAEECPSLVKLEENSNTNFDDSIPPNACGSQDMTSSLKNGQESLNLNGDSREQSRKRTQVWNLLEKTGYASRATELTVRRIMEKLTNNTLQTEEQLADLLGVESSTQATGVHIKNGSDVSINEEPQIEVDVDEASESYWELSTSSNNSIQEKMTPSTIDSEFQNISNEKFDSREENNTHSKKAGGKSFKCLMCEKMFSHSSSLQRHKRIHTEKTLHECSFCGKVFTYHSHLHAHSRSHTGEKPYQCAICGVRFSQKSQMKKHQRTHTKEKPFECLTCGKAYAYSQNLQDHIKIHTREMQYKCTDCGKQFIHRSSFQIHTRTHTGEKPHQCVVCGKKFNHKSHMKRHQRSHSGEKAHQCTTCEKAFNSRQCLQRHIRTHTGDKPYQCGICRKTFSVKSNLNKHSKIHSTEIRSNV